MFDYKKLAKLAVNYAVYVQPEEKVLLTRKLFMKPANGRFD